METQCPDFDEENQCAISFRNATYVIEEGGVWSFVQLGAVS